MSMESIHGPGLTPATMPPVRPNSAPDPEAQAPTDGSSLPYAPGDAAAGSREASTPQLGEEAPSGVDPDLWSVLTAEEREFFAVARQMGPVTYGRQTSTAGDSALPRGRRLDVRI